MGLFNGQLTRDWTGKIFPNLNRAYTSLNDLGGWFIYENRVALNASWTRVWTCDGVTGPANDGDNTDRLTSVAACSVRGANLTTPQSWGLWEDSQGCQLLISYKGATDDIVFIQYSPGGLYTRSATATHPPTATDSTTLSNENTIVNNTTSLRRTMTIWCADKDWRCVVFRNGGLVRVMALQACTSLCADTVFGPNASGHPAYVGGHHTGVNRATTAAANFVQSPANVNVGSTGDVYMRARVFTAGASRVIRLGAGEITHTAAPGSSITYGNATQGSPTGAPALQGAKPPLMPIIWSGERTANCDGYCATPIDWWLCMMDVLSTPAINDFMPGFQPSDTPGVTTPRTNWLCAIGPTCIWPWLNAAASIDTAL